MHADDLGLIAKYLWQTRKFRVQWKYLLQVFGKVRTQTQHRNTYGLTERTRLQGSMNLSRNERTDEHWERQRYIVKWFGTGLRSAAARHVKGNGKRD